jgi:dTDP-4-dehydrorhamnose reductase
MKILLFGKNGQLGWELQRTLAPLGEMYAFGSADLDLGNLKGLAAMIHEVQPQLIVNASAYTAVDRAEQEPEIAMLVNAKAPTVIAEAAYKLKCACLHYSTDYVFDGTKQEPYVETDPVNPLNVYGDSKLKGEQAIQSIQGADIILRTSWVYSLRGNGFVTKTLAWARQQQTLRIVADQTGSPTWARMLAQLSAAIVVRGLPSLQEYFFQNRGIYHLGGAGAVSRFDFSRAILQYDPKAAEQVLRSLEPALTSDFPTPAQRPLSTALDCSYFERTFGMQVPGWEETLKLAMDY